MDFIRIAEAAALLEVSQRTIYNYINDGILTLYKIKRSKPRLNKQEVEKLLEPVIVKNNTSSDGTNKNN